MSKTARNDNKGLTIKINLFSTENFEDFSARSARLWIRGMVTHFDGDKQDRKEMFNDAGELITIIGKWNVEKYKENKKAKKRK
jgi:hypothetical protein